MDGASSQVSAKFKNTLIDCLYKKEKKFSLFYSTYFYALFKTDWKDSKLTIAWLSWASNNCFMAVTTCNFMSYLQEIFAWLYNMLFFQHQVLLWLLGQTCLQLKKYKNKKKKKMLNETHNLVKWIYVQFFFSNKQYFNCQHFPKIKSHLKLSRN